MATLPFSANAFSLHIILDAIMIWNDGLCLLNRDEYFVSGQQKILRNIFSWYKRKIIPLGLTGLELTHNGVKQE